MKLLLISNSTNAGEAYLAWPQNHIKDFCKRHQVKKVLFIPYAGVNLSPDGLEASYNLYESKVAGVFASLGLELTSIHRYDDPVAAVRQAECVATGGGNTFHLVAMLHQYGLMQAIRERALDGMPYMGWSAGSNVACPSLRTTNDMPIYQPESFECMNLIPFQINPHYLDANPDGHAGETREQRIEEFLAINRDMTVVGLREACLLEVDGSKLDLKGSRNLRIFRYGKPADEVAPGTELNYLLQ
jgi:dipeptidase E